MEKRVAPVEDALNELKNDGGKLITIIPVKGDKMNNYAGGAASNTLVFKRLKE